MDHYERLFVFSAAGLGLLLVGVLNLSFGRSGHRLWLCAAALAACAAVVAGLGALTRPALAAQAGALVLGALVLAAAPGSAWVSRRVAALWALLRAPRARWGLVAAGGLVVLLGGVAAFELADEARTLEQMRDLELLLGKPQTQPSDRGRAATDRGSPVVLREPLAARVADELGESEERALREARLRDQLMRRGGPDEASNCHGWVFTGGKFHLSPDDVELILKENGYQEVSAPQAGDLVIYRQGGVIAHTAVVRYVTEGQPTLVEGKWGALGVYLHPVDKSCYGAEYTFHRSPRAGHLLAGLGGAPGSAEPAHTPSE